MKSESFEAFKVKNLNKILGGYTIYCKDAAGNNLGTVEHDCLGSVSGLTACQGTYATAAQSAGHC